MVGRRAGVHRPNAWQRRSHAPFSWALSAILGLLARAHAAHADDASRDGAPLDWSLDVARDAQSATCPDADTLAKRVAERLGRDPFSRDAPRSMRVRFARIDGKFVATIASRASSDGPERTRSLSAGGATCDELARSVALSIALVVDVWQRRHDEEPAPPQKTAYPSPEAPPEKVLKAHPDRTPREREPGSEPPREAPSPFHPTVAAGVGLAVAAGPSPAPNASIAIGIAHPRWSLEAGARADTFTTARGPAQTSVSAAPLTGTLTPCLVFGVFGACPTAHLGVLRGRSSGAIGPASESTFYAAAGLRARVDWPERGVLAGRLRVDVLAPLTPTTLRIGTEDVWHTPPLGVILGFDLLARPR